MFNWTKTTIKEVINTIKEARDYSRPWTINEDGTINENALMNIANAGMRIREENAYIEKAAEEYLTNNSAGWNGDENILAFDIKELKKQEKGFLKRVIQLGYEKIGGDMGKLSSNHLDSAADLVYNKFPPKYIMMPGGINARLKNKK